ncbi:MAG: protein kinase [Anaerolineales bacterium]|nr:protein kinase [Anaerolineales bacterium]
MTLSAGNTLQNRYRIVKLLGQGGFGAVYRAWDTSLSRPCAVKENLNTSPEAQRQFNREASLLANLTHPNLPRVTDYFLVPDQGQYLVMDFVEGDDLQTLMERSQGPLPQEQTLAWIGQICDALGYLHDHNPPIIHRDIKPANIKITPSGQAVLVDFGIAKAFDPTMQTTMGARAVTPGYSPTEQYGIGQTDARSDIYALGATLYALLTGEKPPESVQRGLGGDTLRPPRLLNPAISPAVEAAIMRAMEIYPDRRFARVNDFKIAWTRPVQPAQVMRAGPIAPRPVAAQPPYAAVPPTARPAFPPRSSEAPEAKRRTSPMVWLGAAGVLGLGLIILVIVVAGFLMNGGSDQDATRTALAGAANATPIPTHLPGQTAAVFPTDTPFSEPGAGVQTSEPLASATPTPVLEMIYIEPYCSMFNQSPVSIKEHQPVTLQWRWDALTPELLEEHIQTATYEIYLDGARIQAERMSDIQYLSDEKHYRVYWYAFVGVLPPGSHRAERYLSWSRQISDGWNTFGPGGKTESEYHYCDIIVR